MLWIDRIEIAKHREISKSVREDKINPYIEDAQRLDIKPLLGERLYNAIDADVESHALLLDGGPYTVNGIEYNHPGLRKVLSIFSHARYIIFGSFTDTAFGFVEKSSQDSRSVSGSDKKMVYTQNRQTAGAYFAEVSLFMTRKKYDLWNSGCTPSRTGFRISKIT